ncbi:MAG: hypothetical protein BJ554DRAFT_4360 [Olpidium bornovanus]|uniref:Uncharacterized protein n=1 Tax=Olpidium bornovanus TaxID=278681 RepID=A0A8H7ZMU7_9FUNG|nr:MAG: hypothetical protein BJ554DRAFT_4360 [Olpidium bornovanus]
MRLLEVGALSSVNYAKESSWIAVTSIDLDNTHDVNVIKADFMEYAAPDSESGLYDVLSLSLVVNFVGDPVDR